MKGLRDDHERVRSQPVAELSHPMCAAFGFPPVEPVEDRPVVDLDGNRVFLRGRLFKTFCSETNAARVASALMTLEALDCLPGAS
jgi:hypothetical protein